MRTRRTRCWSLAVSLLIATGLHAEDRKVTMTFRNPPMLETALWLPDGPPDARIRYGQDSPLQFGDLRLPEGTPPDGGFPVVVFVHGGGWLSDWTKDYSSRFVESLTGAGFATWDLEFRRLGNEGGGYPGTFLDVAAGTDHVRELASRYPLDLDRVVVVGHSSGGHLALWIAGRHRIPAASPLAAGDPLPLAGVVSLAGVNDLETSLQLGNRTDVLTLSGIDSPQHGAARFDETNPARLLPFGVPQSLIVGTRDSDWRIAMTRAYADSARAAGDTVTLQIPDGADHFDVVDPEGPAPALVAAAIRDVLAQSDAGRR